MWAIFLLAFGALVVAGALLMGWGFLLVAVLGLVFASFAAYFVVQRARGERRTDGYHAKGPSEARDPSEAAPSETPTTTAR
jgi:membrane protein implicated in regulation of membrane protease activity